MPYSVPKFVQCNYYNNCTAKTSGHYGSTMATATPQDLHNNY